MDAKIEAKRSEIWSLIELWSEFKRLHEIKNQFERYDDRLEDDEYEKAEEEYFEILPRYRDLGIILEFWTQEELDEEE